MNNKLIILLISLLLLFAFVFNLSTFASADALTVEQIVSAAYAYGQAAGINFGFTGGTVTGAQTWMENRINTWLAGRTIIEAFGSEVLRVSSGKLIIPSSLAMNIASFLRDLITDEEITVDNPVIVSQGSYDGIPMSNNQTSFVYERPTDGVAMFRFDTSLPIYPKIGASSGTYGVSRLYISGISVHDFNNSGRYFSFHYWNLSQVEAGKIRCNYVTSTSDSKDGERIYSTSYYDFTPSGNITDKLEISLDENYGYPEFPDIGYNWEGDIGASPDINLDQLLGNIMDDVADNNLDVSGEVVSPEVPPTPAPTPIPIDPDIPLQDVPWEGLNDLIGQTGAGINEQIQSQTQSITSAQEATTEAVEELTDTIADAFDVPDSQEIPDFKFDLREFFPFCIPFDIYRLLTSFEAEPVAPHVQIPFVIQSLNFSYNIDLDFSVFDPVAQVLRTVEFIVYALGLAWATGKVIKW